MKNMLRFLTTAVVCALLQLGLPGDVCGQPASDEPIDVREAEFEKRLADLEAQRAQLDAQFDKLHIERQAYHQAQARKHLEERKQDWLDHEDPSSPDYEARKGFEERRWELEAQRIQLEDDFHAEEQAFHQQDHGPDTDHEGFWNDLDSRRQEAQGGIDDEWQQIDQDEQEYWDQHAEDHGEYGSEGEGHGDEYTIEDMRAERDAWEEEQSSRRDEDEFFDEAAHDFEAGQWDGRLELEEQRIALEEQLTDLDQEFNDELMRLEEKGLKGRVADRARGAIEKKFDKKRKGLDRGFQKIDEEFQRMDQEGQEFWEQHAVEMEAQAADAASGWPPGPNSVRLVVDSADGGEVKLRLEIADSDPIVGWTLQVDYDNEALEFSRFEKGDFITGFFSPGEIVKDDGVELGGATLQQANAAAGDGVLGTVVFNVTGGLPTWVGISGLDLQGDVSREITPVTEPLEIGP